MTGRQEEGGKDGGRTQIQDVVLRQSLEHTVTLPAPSVGQRRNNKHTKSHTHTVKEEYCKS